MHLATDRGLEGSDTKDNSNIKKGTKDSATQIAQDGRNPGSGTWSEEKVIEKVTHQKNESPGHE